MTDTPDAVLADLAANVRNAKQASEDAQTTLSIAQAAASEATAALDAASAALNAYITSLVDETPA